MKFSQLVTKTAKQIAESDVSRNAQLLTRAGYISRLMAGVYSYLPLGLRVLTKVENIVREEMNAIGGQEILMPALQPREIWDTTGRWEGAQEVMFSFKGPNDREVALGPTHEEVVTPLVQQFVHSYRDLPTAVYQMQTKFRKEARAKSGLLRGREFRMKDLYSFHRTQVSLDEYYERAIQAYRNVYKRCGLGDITFLTVATGGMFSKYSHEFQTVTPFGEDVIYKIPGQNLAINKEIINDEEALQEFVPGYAPGKDLGLEEVKSIEVGNIFKLGTKFTGPFNMNFTDAEGKQNPIVMGCYGIGISRVVGTVAEVLSDDAGLIWPGEVAPYQVHLITLARDEAERARTDEIYAQLMNAGIEVLYDDRLGPRAGEKLADADLLGIPMRVLISHKTLEKNSAEVKARADKEAQLIPLEGLLEFLKK